MPLTSTNKYCQQCIHACKQWSQTKVVFCPIFSSTQRKKHRSKNTHTLQAEENTKKLDFERDF